jgi:hypothetical protein
VTLGFNAFVPTGIIIKTPLRWVDSHRKMFRVTRIPCPGGRKANFSTDFKQRLFELSNLKVDME